MVTTPRTPIDVRSILQAYMQNTVMPAQNSIKFGSVDVSGKNPPQADFGVFVHQMEVAVQAQKNSLVADIIARGAPWIWDAVRMVNENSNNGFGGITSRSTELVAIRSAAAFWTRFLEFRSGR